MTVTSTIAAINGTNAGAAEYASVELPSITVKVDQVVDGDTLDVFDASGNTLRVRLIGIDAPESTDCEGPYASTNLDSLLGRSLDGDVNLTAVSNIPDTDKFGRLMRYVGLPDGTDLGYEQIRGGYAVARYDSRDDFRFHPRQPQYIAVDSVSQGYHNCVGTTSNGTRGTSTSAPNPAPDYGN